MNEFFFFEGNTLRYNRQVVMKLGQQCWGNEMKKLTQIIF
jgi:hypothetical protein